MHNCPKYQIMSGEIFFFFLEALWLNTNIWSLLSKENDEQVFLIMNCVFPAEASKFISERFDLKGSTVGRWVTNYFVLPVSLRSKCSSESNQKWNRECSVEERKEKGSNAILKDLDLAKEVSVMGSLAPSFKPKDCGISIGPSAKSALLSQLRRGISAGN